MNSISGVFHIPTENSRRHTMPVRETDVHQLTHQSANYHLDVSLDTTTACWYVLDDRSVLLWGANSARVELATDSGLSAYMDRLAREPANALKTLRGGWGLAFADGNRNRLLLAVDRAARSSVCFSPNASGFAFGLTARDVGAMRDGGGAIRSQALFDYLYSHVISAPETVFADVERLQPGEFLEFDGESVTRNYYWQPTYGSAEASSHFFPAREEMMTLLERAVRREVGPGKTAAFLSGGTDSSTIAGMLTKVTNQPAETYSIGFDAPGFDEMEYARIAARHFHTNQNEYYVTPDDLVTSIPEVARAYDQPFGNSSALPAFFCARLAATDGVTKMLGGDGGDEIFGGNTRYVKQRMFDAYRHMPRWLDRTVVESLLVRPTLTARIPLISKVRSYVEQARVPMPDRMRTYNLVERLGAEAIFTEAFLAQVDTAAPAHGDAAWYAQCGHPAIVNKMLQYDWKYTLADNDLPKVVGTCNMVGVRVGFPMLDEDLVEFANALPASWKVKGVQLRPFFKSALAGFLPRKIIRKKKHGFGLPFGLWLRKHAGLQQLAFGSLESFRDRGVVRREFIDNFINTRLQEHAGYYGELVWTMIMLEQWLQAYAPHFNSK